MKEFSPQESEIMQPAVSFQSEQSSKAPFTYSREFPENLKSLESIAWNYYWSWQSGGSELFRELDPGLWQKCEQNPRLFLRRIPQLRLWEKSTDSEFVTRVAKLKADLDEYMSADPISSGRVTPENPAAYFCAEYGVHNSLPNYSGGLGILAGDHLKSASDLNIPLVAIGLLYRYGYFRQKISHDGWQEERYLDVFDSELALRPVYGEMGERVLVSVDIRGRQVFAQAWLAQIGRINLYLLDTNLPVNSEVDRLITGHLYGGDAETRIVQEKILGIGGVRLLRKLGVSPSVFHLNEGHSAFLTLELAREFLFANPDADFAAAVENVRGQCVFTTHTPVEAGNDVFPPEKVAACFSSSFVDSLRISGDEFFALGRTNPTDENEGFGMTPLALRMSRSANGVSEKHGEVSRELWLRMFPELESSARVPITHITNGVHAPTWIAPLLKKVYEKHIGSNWPELVRDEQAWRAAIDQIPDDEIWRAHRHLKQLLISFVRNRTLAKETGSFDTINEREDTRRLFDPDVLTIGFARRVAAYKRWNLLMTDLDRLLRLVDHADRPVQFVFAGKAHPQDRVGKQLLQNLMRINHNSEWQNRAVFVEDYDQEVARFLVHGVDVWMNVPRRPLEASGTSGQKSAMNGGLNFSILDGWWIEGYNGINGFSIGELDPGDDQEKADADDAESLYRILEEEIVPTFYDLDGNGLPSKWIARMKDALATLTPKFSSDRMVRDYLEQIYR